MKELRFIEDHEGIVTLGSDGMNFYLPSEVESAEASFTIDETCDCVYDSSVDDRVIVCKKDDRALVVTLNWDNDIERILILGISPDNITPEMIN